MNAADCPDLGYTDKADCVRYINENFYIDAGDPVCDAAAISYLECGVNLNCVQLFNETGCRVEYAEFVNACFK